VQAAIASTKGSASDFNLPLLEGRALVTLEFKRNGGTPLPSNFVKLVVDGINYPLNGGNFIELCLKGAYKNIPVACDSYSFAGNSITRTLLGVTKKGYIDPKTHLQRRVPLEVLREDDTLDRFTTVGFARNSAVFTRAKPVQSFASYGALGMLHMPGDGNGASSSFFFVPPDRSITISERHLLPVVTRMNQRFSLFAHCIDGNDVLGQLKSNDVLLSAKVEEGAWRLIPPPLQK
jgi:cyclophilin family peptidyl-prolyl cis-trans isomerase